MMRYYSKPKNKGCLWTVITFPFYLVYLAMLLCGSFLIGVFTFLWELIKLPFIKSKALTGVEYEYNIAAYLKRKGYWGVKVTKASGDYGVDITAHKYGKKYAVQCKYYTQPVGVAAVQEVVAGRAYYGCDRAMVVTNSTYTTAAKELAKCNNVTLLEGVSPTETHIHVKPVKWLAIAVYVFVMSAAMSAAFDVIKTQTFGVALYNTVTLLIVVTAPLWAWCLYKMIKKKIKEKTAAKTEQLPKTPITVTPLVLPKYANTEKIYNLLSKSDCFVSIEDVEKIVALEVVTTSKIQRTLKYGYARAARLMDLLLENEYIIMTDKFIYKWSYKAE